MRRSLRFAIATALLAGLVLGTGTVAAAKGGHHKILDVPLIGLAVPQDGHRRGCRRRPRVGDR